MNSQVIEFLELIKEKIKQEEEYYKLEFFLAKNEYKVYFEIYKNLVELYRNDPVKDDDAFYSVAIITDNKSVQDLDDNIKRLIRSYNSRLEDGSKAIAYASIGNSHNTIYPIRIDSLVNLLKQDGLSCSLIRYCNFYAIEDYKSIYKPNKIIVTVKGIDFKNMLASNDINQGLEDDVAKIEKH